MSRVPPDRSAQIGNARIETTVAARGLIADGYDPHCVAEALLQAARDLLESEEQFLTVLIGYLQFNSQRAWSFRGSPD